MWGNIATEATFQTNFNVGFSNTRSDILIHLSQWQYWWWFWFVFLWSLYFMLIIRVVRFRTLKFQPRIVTSFRPHGKWGDLLVCLIPTMWCINILINSTFLLKLIEWQNETSLFTIRIRGKQWYWIYKFDVKDIADILSIGKNVGHDKFFFPTPNSLDNLDDYLRLIQLRASNAWLKKYWDVSLKLQAKENYDHLVASSDQVLAAPIYKSKTPRPTSSNMQKFSEFQMSMRKAADFCTGINSYVNYNGRAGFTAQLHHHFVGLPTKDLLNPSNPDFLEEKLRKAYRFSHTFTKRSTFYDIYLTRKNSIVRYFFPRKYKYCAYDSKLNPVVINIKDIGEVTSSFRDEFLRAKSFATFNLLKKFRESAPFVDYSLCLKDYSNYRGRFTYVGEHPVWEGQMIKSYVYAPLTGEVHMWWPYFRYTPRIYKQIHYYTQRAKLDNTLLLNYKHPEIQNDTAPFFSSPNNFYVPTKKSVNFDEGLRWIKRGFGTNEPLKLVKVSYDKGEGFLFKTRYAANDTAMHKNVTYNPYLVIKQKRYTLKKKILEKNFKTHNKNFKPNKDRIVVSNSNFFLKNNVTTETYDNLTRLYKFFKKNKKRDEMFSVVTARRLLRTKRTLVLPAHVNITAITNSYDVVHSWFIPGLGLKLDCIPGRATHHTFYADNVGFYYGQCAEICGRYHHHMPIRLCILPYDQFLVWWHHFGLPKLMYSGKNRVHTNNFYFRKYVW